MDKGWDCTAETPTWDGEFQSEKLLFQSLLKVIINPSACQPGWWKWAASLCQKARTPLSGCAYSLWNTCFVGLMEFFGPWFYERQYFHNPVNVDISKWLPAGTNGTGTNLIPDGTLYTLQTSWSPLNARAPASGQVLGQWGMVNQERH